MDGDNCLASAFVGGTRCASATVPDRCVPCVEGNSFATEERRNERLSNETQSNADRKRPPLSLSSQEKREGGGREMTHPLFSPPFATERRDKEERKTNAKSTTRNS